MRYATFLFPLVFLLQSCTKTKLETVSYNSFKIQSLTVNKIPFTDINDLYFDEDSLLDLSIEPFDQTKRKYRKDDCSPGMLPLEITSAGTDSSDIFNTNGLIPFYLYDLDDSAGKADFIGRIAFEPADYLGKERFTVQDQNGTIELAFSVKWYQ